MTTILIVGAADTGRAPMAAALLRRRVGARGYGWEVESAGVLGHDGAAAETEARDTMVHMGLDIGAHRARSIDDTLVARAALIIGIDGGAARVVRARFPDARIFSLGELAGRSRDIPDPFRMQLGAWMTYAREIAAMLDAAMPRIAALMPALDGRSPLDPSTPLRAGDRPADDPQPLDDSQPVDDADSGLDDAAADAPSPPSARDGAADRIEQLLQVAIKMPGVVDWAAARGRIEADLATVAAAPIGPGDLAAAYVGLLRAALGLLPAAPSERQLMALQQAAARLRAAIGQQDLNDLSAQLATL